MSIAGHFHKLLKPLFPENARIMEIDEQTSELIFLVDWRVPTDARPSRRSHPIRIEISRDVLDDYRDDPSYRERMDRFITAHIGARYAQYVDDGIAAPPLVWKVTPAEYPVE